jgi:hypothetical protein
MKALSALLCLVAMVWVVSGQTGATCASVLNQMQSQGHIPVPCVQVPACSTGQYGNINSIMLSDGSAPMKQSSTIMACYTPDALTVKFNYGNDPFQYSTYTQCNQNLYNQEVFEIFISPSTFDPPIYHEFELSPNNVLFAAKIFNPYLNTTNMSNEYVPCSEITNTATKNLNTQIWSGQLNLPFSVINDVSPSKESDYPSSDADIETSYPSSIETSESSIDETSESSIDESSIASVVEKLLKLQDGIYPSSLDKETSESSIGGEASDASFPSSLDEESSESSFPSSLDDESSESSLPSSLDESSESSLPSSLDESSEASYPSSMDETSDAKIKMAKHKKLRCLKKMAEKEKAAKHHMKKPAAPPTNVWRANMFREQMVTQTSSCNPSTCLYGAWSPTYKVPPSFHWPVYFGVLVFV